MLYITRVDLDLTEQHHFQQETWVGAPWLRPAALIRLDMAPRWYLSATIIDFRSEEQCTFISGDVDGSVLLYRSEFNPRGEYIYI